MGDCICVGVGLIADVGVIVDVVSGVDVMAGVATDIVVGVTFGRAPPPYHRRDKRLVLLLVQ